jgi:DNA-binding MarR family transcriptional regulator
MSASRRPQSTVDRPGYLIKQAQAALNAQMARALHEHGVTLSQFAVLTALAEEPGLSNAELARRAFITPQSMNENLRELEGRTWITRSRHPAHGRILQIELTEEGRTTLQSCDVTVTVIEQRMLAGLDPDQRRQLTTALRTCILALDSVQPEAVATMSAEAPAADSRSSLRTIR